MEIIDVGLEFNDNYEERNIDSITRIILHHTGVSVEQDVETIHNYHKNTRGYAGIGYHFYVRKEGSIYKGRPIEWVGAHAYGNNYDSIGVCAEGNFYEEDMSDAQKNALNELLPYLKQTYGIDVVQAHRDVDSTSCPGDNYPFDEIANSTGGDAPLKCKVHIQDEGWTDWIDAGNIAGTVGQAKRLEAIILDSKDIELKYRAHVENIGWQDWVEKGQVAGTTNQALRLEALEIDSSVPLKVSEHLENVGWMPASTGCHVRVGTEGKALRLEAIKIELA